MIDEEEIKKLQKWSKEDLCLLIAKQSQNELKNLLEENRILREEIKKLKELWHE